MHRIFDVVVSLIVLGDSRITLVDTLVNEIPFQDSRRRVNPGITGWVQICYPYGASREDANTHLIRPTPVSRRPHGKRHT